MLNGSHTNEPPSKCLDDRREIKTFGKTTYLKGVATAVARRLNDYVEKMRQFGETEASKVSDEALSQFNREHSLSKYFDSLESSVEDHAADLKTMLAEYGQWMVAGSLRIDEPVSFSELPQDLRQNLRLSISVGRISEDIVVFLRRPAAVVKSWLNTRVDRSQIAKVSHKVNDIMKQVNEVGEVAKSKRYAVTFSEKLQKLQSYEAVPSKGIAVILTQNAFSGACTKSNSATNATEPSFF